MDLTLTKNLTLTGDIVKGIYLLILMIIGGITAPTFSKQGNDFLHKNYMAKHIIILCIIYFCINYSRSKIEHPMQTLLITVIIYSVYIVISNQDLTFTILIFSLITGLYFMFDYMNYYKDQYKKNKDNEVQSKINTLDKVITFTSYGTLVVSVIGFMKYYVYQKGLRGNKFKTSKFLFGHGI
jgi:hypothetical protein